MVVPYVYRCRLRTTSLPERFIEESRARARSDYHPGKRSASFRTQSQPVDLLVLYVWRSMKSGQRADDTHKRNSTLHGRLLNKRREPPVEEQVEANAVVTLFDDLDDWLLHEIRV